MIKIDLLSSASRFDHPKEITKETGNRVSWVAAAQGDGHSAAVQHNQSSPTIANRSSSKTWD